MRKINYRITVNITQKTMKLGFRAKMPEEMEGKRIRVQAVFTPVSYTHLDVYKRQGQEADGAE